MRKVGKEMALLTEDGLPVSTESPVRASANSVGPPLIPVTRVVRKVGTRFGKFPKRLVGVAGRTGFVHIKSGSDRR